VGESTDNHSVAQVDIAPGKASIRHFHPKATESYYVLKGSAKIEIGNETAVLKPGQIVLIPPPQPHEIFNIGSADLVFLVICVPAWEPTNTVWLEDPGAA
jgi:mannose-6-phosphate isomerase-like protein (cupin superfamily)